MTDIPFSNTEQHRCYIGRFAPSPSGPLHFGSLVTAVASYVDAKYHKGQWLLRMEDIDPPREEAGAQQRILDSLQAHGLDWDGDVFYQSQRLDDYQATLNQLQHSTYRCRCTRKRQIDLKGVYDGYCKHNSVNPQEASAIRVDLDQLRPNALDVAENFNDVIQGQQHQNLHKEVGDFIIRRKDGLMAYQLAVVADDITQGVTHIIRGHDLLSSTCRQRYLIQLLDGDMPTYGHIPVAANELGQKLSKQHGATAIADSTPTANIYNALTFLNHTPPKALQHGHQQQLLEWATAHWQREKIPSQASIRFEE